MNYISVFFFLISLPLVIFGQGWVPPGEVRAIEQAFVDGEQTGSYLNNGGYYGNGYGYNNYGGYGGYYGKK